MIDSMNQCHASRLLTGLLLAFIAPALFAEGEPSTYFDDSQRGWFWRELPPEPIEEELIEEDVPPSVVIAPAQEEPVLSPREQLKRQGEEWEDAMASAILDPSPENYRRYLELTDAIMAQSQDFATGMKRSIWTTPEYDYTLQAPVSPEAIVVKSSEQNRKNDAALSLTAQDKGLLFFFESDCGYCTRFAPILKQFEQQYGFHIIPISLDGVGIPGYENPQPNVALGDQLNVDHIPALYLVDPDLNTVAPIGFGYTPWSELQQKVLYASTQINQQGEGR